MYPEGCCKNCCAGQWLRPHHSSLPSSLAASFPCPNCGVLIFPLPAPHYPPLLRPFFHAMGSLPIPTSPFMLFWPAPHLEERALSIAELLLRPGLCPHPHPSVHPGHPHTTVHPAPWPSPSPSLRASCPMAIPTRPCCVPGAPGEEYGPGGSFCSRRYQGAAGEETAPGCARECLDGTVGTHFFRGCPAPARAGQRWRHRLGVLSWGHGARVALAEQGEHLGWVMVAVSW